MSHVFRSEVKFLRELCKAVDLDPDAHPILSVTLESRVRDLATVTVKIAVTQEQDDKIAEMIKRYALNPRRIGD